MCHFCDNPIEGVCVTCRIDNHYIAKGMVIRGELPPNWLDDHWCEVCDLMVK